MFSFLRGFLKFMEYFFSERYEELEEDVEDVRLLLEVLSFIRLLVCKSSLSFVFLFVCELLVFKSGSWIFRMSYLDFSCLSFYNCYIGGKSLGNIR